VRLTRLEKVGSLLGVALVTASLLLASLFGPEISNLLQGLGVASVAAVVGSVLKDWRWRTLAGRYGLDPSVRAYVRRAAAGYSQLLQTIDFARQVDITGISLSYVIEYVCDNPREVMSKIERPIRVLLPGNKRICDDRDTAQGTPVGSLKRDLQGSLDRLGKLRQSYPRLLQVRFFRISPYFAMTRIDDELWVSLYVTKTGSNNPVLKIDQKKSPELFHLFEAHFERVWDDSKSEVPKIAP
jgi:hypothetical protein